MFKTATFWAYGMMVVLAAVPYGLVHPLPLSILCTLMFSVTLVALVVFGPPRRGRQVFLTVVTVVAIVSSWILWQAYGIAPAPSVGSPWHSYNEVFGDHKTSLSLAPADTAYSLIFLLLPALTFLTGMMVADSDARTLQLLRILAVGGGCIAIFGLMQFVLAPDKLLIVEKRAYIGSLTAVYVNRNTAATHLGLVLLVLVTLAIQTYRFRHRSPTRRAAKSTGQTEVAVYGALAVCCFLALMLTQSRAGIGATAVGALVLAPALLTRTQGAARGFSMPNVVRRFGNIIPIAGALAIVLALFGLFGERAMQRASETGLEDPRFCMYPEILRMIGDNWLTGTGFGTFRTAFSTYRDPACGIYGVFDRAHNSYLEGFATLGILFPIALAILVAVIFSSFRRGYLERHRMRLFPVLGFAGTLLVAVHAAVDFSLQIPGFAVAYAAFLAATVAVCHGRENQAPGRLVGMEAAGG